MPLPLTGSVSVTNGDDVFVWTGAPLTPLNCVLGASIVVGGLGYFIKELIDTTSGKFTRVYAETTNASQPAEIEQLSPDQVATATLNKRAADVFAALSVIQANGQGRFMRFSDSVTDADPGPGFLRLNNLAIGSATALYIDNLDANGATISDWVDTWDDGTSLIKGTLFLSGLTDRSVFHAFKVTGSVVDGTGYRKSSLAYVGGSGSLSDGDELMMFFAAKGDQGEGFATDAEAADPSGLTAYEGEAVGYLVFVRDLLTVFGAYAGRSGVVRLIAGPAWQLVAFYTGPAGAGGDQGEKGWSPKLVLVADGARFVFKLLGYVGGAGTAPTANVGDYLKDDGTWTSTIGDAANVRGPAGLNGAGTVASVVAKAGIVVDNTDPTAPGISAKHENIALSFVNGRIGDMRAILKAVRAGAATCVGIGDSIFEGVNNIDYSNSPFGLITRYLKENVGGVTWDVRDLSVSGKGLGDLDNAAYNPTHTAGPSMAPPNHVLWPTGDTPAKSWLEWAQAAAPDIVFIALGMNTGPAGDANGGAGALNSIITKINAWAKIPTIVVVTPILPTEDPGSPASPATYVQAMSDALRGVAEQRNVCLADANALYRMHRHGVDILRPTMEVQDGFADYASWVAVSGTKPPEAGGVLTFAVDGWVRRTRQDIDIDLSADLAPDTGDVADITYRQNPADANECYIARISRAGSFTWWFNLATLFTVGVTPAASYTVHVKAFGARHEVWVNGVKIALPNSGYHYGRLYPGHCGLFAQSGATISNFTARFGHPTDLIGFQTYSEADLLGIDDFGTNPLSLGGNGINHPSVLACRIDYFASVLPVLGEIEAVNGERLIGPRTISDKSVNGVTLSINNTDSSASYGTIGAHGTNGDGIAGWPSSFVVEAVPGAGGNFVIDAYTGSILFQTARTTKGRFDASGNFVVGAAVTGGGKINIQVGAANSTGLRMDGSTGNFIGIDYVNSVAQSTTANIARFFHGGLQTGGITANGGTTNFATTSDYRRKPNIEALEGYSDRIDAVEPRWFKWDSGTWSAGFIAHEFAEVYPGSVIGEKDAVDEKGDPIHQAMQASSSEVMADIIAELQMLRRRVARLEAAAEPSSDR